MALWMALVDEAVLPELLVGGAIAALAATAARLARADEPAGGPLPRGWAQALARSVRSVPGDLGPLVRTLLLRGVLRRPRVGTTSRLPLRTPADPDRRAAHLALTEVLGSLAPGTLVVDLDPERGWATVHQLEPTDDVAARALPLEVDEP